MPLPSIVLGAAIALLLGSIFHLWKDGGFWKLVIYLILSLLGFFIGNKIADSLGIEFLDMGLLHIGLGIVGSLVSLFVGHWLSLIEVQPKGSK